MTTLQRLGLGFSHEGNVGHEAGSILRTIPSVAYTVGSEGSRDLEDQETKEFRASRLAVNLPPFRMFWLKLRFPIY